MNFSMSKPSEEKRAYVLGCLGFIGSWITTMLLEQGYRVIGVDNMTPVHRRDFLNDVKDNTFFSFIEKDICDLDNLYDCDWIINCAAETHVDNSLDSNSKFMKTNVEGVVNILNLMKTKNNTAASPKLIHFSTDEVYGDILEGSHAESSPLKPSNPYAASKAAADMFILGEVRTNNVQAMIIRPTNNYGIGQYPEKLIPLTVRNLRRGHKIRLHDKGTPVRSWLHVKDTCRAVECLMKKGRMGEIYNVDAHLSLQNIEVVKKIISNFHQISEEEVDRDFLRYVDLSYSRRGQDLRYSLDDSKIQELGWEPKECFNDELEDIVEYYKWRFIW